MMRTTGWIAFALVLIGAPVAQAQHTWMRVPGADDLVCQELHALDDSTLWMLGDRGGVRTIFTSTDGGETLEPSVLPPAFRPSRIIVLDADRAIAFGENPTHVTARRTDDGGASWSEPVVVHPKSDPSVSGPVNTAGWGAADGIAIVITPLGVFESPDGGASWSMSNGPPGHSRGSLSAFVVDRMTFFAIGNNRNELFRTTDAGASWDVVLRATTPPDDSVGEFTGAAFLDANRGVVGNAAGSFLTTDGGESWNPVTEPEVSGARGTLRRGAWASATHAIAILEGASNVWSFVSTTDGGETWVEDVEPPDFFDENPRQPDCFQHPSNEVGYAGDRGALRYSLMRFGMPGTTPPVDAGAPDADAGVVSDAGGAAGSDAGSAGGSDAGDGGGGGDGCSVGRGPASSTGLIGLALLALLTRRRRRA